MMGVRLWGGMALTVMLSACGGSNVSVPLLAPIVREATPSALKPTSTTLYHSTSCKSRVSRWVGVPSFDGV